jgi:hypothetical protein
MCIKSRTTGKLEDFNAKFRGKKFSKQQIRIRVYTKLVIIMVFE